MAILEALEGLIKQILEALEDLYLFFRRDERARRAMVVLGLLAASLILIYVWVLVRGQ